MKKILPLVCITSLFLFGCFQEKTYWHTGELKTIGSYKDDKQEGEWKVYNNNGRLLCINHFGIKTSNWSGVYSLVAYMWFNISKYLNVSQIEHAKSKAKAWLKDFNQTYSNK